MSICAAMKPQVVPSLRVVVDFLEGQATTEKSIADAEALVAVWLPIQVDAGPTLRDDVTIVVATLRRFARDLRLYQQGHPHGYPEYAAAMRRLDLACS